MNIIKTPEQEALIAKIKQENYGMTVSLDLNEVPFEFFTEESVKQFAADLCDSIGMRKGPLHIWGEDKDLGQYLDDPKKDGFSVVQFLWESSITIHALDQIQKVFIDVFSCKDFSPEMVKQFSIERTGGKVVSEQIFVRH